MAIAGRSNVGKSSLINALIGRHGLARISATPGRTRQINFFLLNDRFTLVDLPGYGFAVGPAKEREAWGPLIEGYLRGRETLRGVILIIDVRRGFESEETDLLAWLAEAAIPAAVIATKTDKLSSSAAATAVRRLQAVAPAAVSVVGFSARNGAGRDDVWRVVRGWLQQA